MRVSFSFTGVLDKTTYQLIARSFSESGVNVYIIYDAVPTESQLNSVLAIADFCKIPVSNVINTHGNYKTSTINLNRIDLHFENSLEEARVLRYLTKKCKIIIV